MAAGEQVARLPTAALVAALGEFVEIRKSQKDGKKYPLYMVTPWGPWPINTANGQNFLLENGLFNGAQSTPAPEPLPEPAPEPPGEVVEIIPGEELDASEDSSGLGRLFSGLGDFD